MSIERFQKLEDYPEDPIFSVYRKFEEDERKEKVNLGIGVITNEEGELYAFKCFENLLLNKNNSYLPISGDNDLKKHFAKVFLPFVPAGQVVSVQTVGGTYANYLSAKLLKKLGFGKIYFPKPTWSNHLSLFKEGGLAVEQLEYYDDDVKKISENFLLEVKNLPENSILALDVCGHNPTGVDLNSAELEEVIKIGKEKKLVYFLDAAYVGLVGESIEDDMTMVKKIYESGNPILLSFSFSKNMSLYGHRLGILSVMNFGGAGERIKSNLDYLVRSSISSASRFASDFVCQVLSDEKILNLWQEELLRIRNYLLKMRKEFSQKLQAQGIDWGREVQNQNGLFSLLPELKTEELQKNFGIYIPPNGRVNVSGLKESNLDVVVKAIVESSL